MLRFGTGVVLACACSLIGCAVGEGQAPDAAATAAGEQAQLALGLTRVTQYGDWSPAVNLGATINGPFLDSCAAISKDGRSLIYSSNRIAAEATGNPDSTDRELFVSQRPSPRDPWGPPVHLAMLGADKWDSCPALSLDEHRLYFASERAGGCGGEDLWVSYRRDRRDDLGWEPPVHLACEADGGPNGAGRDLTPALFEDEAGKVLMYFTSNRTGTTPAAWELYQTEQAGDGSFGPATPIAELNSTTLDMSPVVRRDGLEVFFVSRRPGGSFGAVAGTTNDFWTATRASTSDPWSKPVFVPGLGSPALAQGRIALSFDGTELYFSSNRAGGLGNWDLWVARRDKVKCYTLCLQGH
jgi:hypothetical protein